MLDGPDLERERDGDVLVFDPTRVTDGIELSGDTILRFRSDGLLGVGGAADQPRAGRLSVSPLGTPSPSSF